MSHVYHGVGLHVGLHVTCIFTQSYEISEKKRHSSRVKEAIIYINVNCRLTVNNEHKVMFATMAI